MIPETTEFPRQSFAFHDAWTSHLCFPRKAVNWRHILLSWDDTAVKDVLRTIPASTPLVMSFAVFGFGVSVGVGVGAAAGDARDTS